MTRMLLPSLFAASLPALLAPAGAAAAPWTCMPVQRVVVTRRVSCGRVEVVKRFAPKRNGRFRVTLQGAKRRQVATFRFRTRVRYRVGNPRLFRTFTLPQFVDIG